MPTDAEKKYQAGLMINRLELAANALMGAKDDVVVALHHFQQVEPNNDDGAVDFTDTIRDIANERDAIRDWTLTMRKEYGIHD